MKVLMISGDPGALKSGSETWQRMAEYGALFDELHILVLAGRNFQFSIFNFQTNYKIQISKNTFVYPCIGRYSRFWKGLVMGRKLLKTASLDIITAQDMEHSFLAWIFSRLYKIPWQMQIHTDVFSTDFVRSPVSNKVRVLLAKFLIPRASCIRVVSERIAKSVTRRLSHQVAVKPLVTLLPIFVDTEEIKAAPIKTDLHQKYGRDKFIILMASRITREKNIGLAIDAVNDLVAKFHKILLLIVGNGLELENLKRKIIDYRLSNNVTLEPYTENLFGYYETCDLFLLTSNYEGYGRTLVEAAVAGAKIVSSDVGIAPEILESECIFKVWDKADLKQKLILALENKLPAPHLPTLPTKEDYFKLYKKSFENCLLVG